MMYFEAVLSRGRLLFVTPIVALSGLVWLGVRFDRQQVKKAIEGIENEVMQIFLCCHTVFLETVFWSQPASEKPIFENMPNFRQAGGSSLYNRHGRKVKDGFLFRSSQPDFLTLEEMNRFLKFGIKAIIDLRRSTEYAQAPGDKILDRVYKLCILKKGKVEDWNHPNQDKIDDSTCKGNRYLVSTLTKELFKSGLSQLNPFIRYTSFSLLVMDNFFGTHLFLRLLNHLIGNHLTAAEQYMTILEHAKPEVASILRLLLDKSNVPVLILCAHGKDRTGVVVALILACLEVDNEIIVNDYALSEVSRTS